MTQPPALSGERRRRATHRLKAEEVSYCVMRLARRARCLPYIARPILEERGAVLTEKFAYSRAALQVVMRKVVNQCAGRRNCLCPHPTASEMKVIFGEFWKQTWQCLESGSA